MRATSNEVSQVRVELPSREAGEGGNCTGDEAGHDVSEIRMWRSRPDVEDPLRFSVRRRSLLPRDDVRPWVERFASDRIIRIFAHQNSIKILPEFSKIITIFQKF